ncbi:peroxiredoxin [Bacillus alkalicellulosilyticus]|uniref:peroxiredoxin n=1 Tax=Alkalihalobacterium alkalicellulosilyticum TaxID=1912214 RepID=UPI00099836B7|nr:peroxiredoxin [Bacillus alkalicellulosilyticus]
MGKHHVPTIGDYLPTLTVRTTLGTVTLPDDYQGQWFLLFSHPGDFTPVCTTEFVSYALHEKQFEQMNCKLIGLSIDSVFSHLKWIEWIKDRLGVSIYFPVIADELGKTAKRLGMIGSRGTQTVRTVYIVDPKGKIRLKLHYPMEVGRNTQEILRSLHALQTADAKKAATPANWPENELFGEQVLLAPPSTVMNAQKRVKEAEEKGYQCIDWWLCSKD